MQATLKLRLVQWRIQQFVPGRELAAWGCAPSVGAGAETPLESKGRSHPEAGVLMHFV